MAALLAGALGFASAMTGAASAWTWPAGRDQQAMALMQQYQAQRAIPSLAVSITLNGQVVFESALQTGGTPSPSGADTAYRIGSVTKQFTAAAILALIEDRAIVPATQQPISLFTSLDDFFIGVGHWSTPITPANIGRLLTMTSNIPSYTQDSLATQPRPPFGVVPATVGVSALEILGRIKTFPLQGVAGSFNYSNSNYLLLAQIVDIVTQNNPPISAGYRNYVRSRILAPAGMTATGFVGDPVPVGLSVAPGGYIGPRLFDQLEWPKGAGDLVSTAADLSRWNKAFISGQLLSPAMLRTMLSPAVATNHPLNSPYFNCSYAMGWFVCQGPGHVLYQHDGEISGFRASNAIARSPDDTWVSVVALANSDQAGDIVELVRGLIRIAQ